MLQLRKLHFCGIFAIFLPVLFYEWNTSINYNFRFFFLGIISWKETSLFNGGGEGVFFFWVGGTSFLSGGGGGFPWGHWFWEGGGGSKNMGWPLLCYFLHTFLIYVYKTMLPCNMPIRPMLHYNISFPLFYLHLVNSW